MNDMTQTIINDYINNDECRNLLANMCKLLVKRNKDFTPYKCSALAGITHGNSASSANFDVIYDKWLSVYDDALLEELRS